MTEPQVTISGPARLRRLAELTILSDAELRQLAALWEADLSNATGLIADATLRAERAEAANMAERQEWSKFYTLMTGDEGAYSLADLTRAINAQIAALAQARALVPFLRGWIETMQSEQGYEDEGTMAWRSWQDMIAEVENVIAALAPDGAR